MANFLAIEAASDSCSVALSCNDTLICRVEAAPRMHSRLLYPMLNNVMDEAGIRPNQLDAVIFGKGPGSFTGLRIAAATAQGIGYACDIPLIGVSTLQAMAQQAYIQHQHDHVLPIMDARMNELYLGQYTLDDTTQLMTSLLDDLVCPISVNAQSIQLTQGQYFACGHGMKLQNQFDDSLASLITHHDSEQILGADALMPLAKHLFAHNNVLAPDEVELVYLREQSHWKTIKQQKENKPS